MKKLLGIIILSFLWFDTSYALPDCKGEEISKWKNCIGTINQDGNIYKGIFSEEPGSLDGVVVYKYNDGGSYIGEVKEGRPHGLGILRTKDGGYYIGQFFNNEKSGWGLYYLKHNDGFYLGQVKNDAINGFGTIVKKLDMISMPTGIFNNFNYVKDSHKIEPQCKGNYISPKDSKDWTNCRGQFNAAGISYDSDFINGVPNGIAWVRLFEGQMSKSLGHKTNTYVGELKISEETGWGEKTGTGVTLFDDYTIEVGSYNNGYYDGKGITVWPNGDIWIGEIKKDKKNGQGDYIFLNGEWQSGMWKDNKMHGLGLQILPDGNRRYGEFKEDKFIE